MVLVGPLTDVDVGGTELERTGDGLRLGGGVAGEVEVDLGRQGDRPARLDEGQAEGSALRRREAPTVPVLAEQRCPESHGRLGIGGSDGQRVQSDNHVLSLGGQDSPLSSAE